MEADPSPAQATALEAPVAVFKRRGAKGKANIRKRPATPPPATNDSDSDYSSSEDESGHRVKRRRQNRGVVAVSSKINASSNQDLAATAFSADRNVPITSANDATKASNWYDDEEANGGLSAKNLLGTTRPAAQSAGASGDGTYKGLANQTSFIQKSSTAPSKTVGPIKAPTNIRTITVIDHAADVCKDYKQTGFCGFGDSCKFLHARESFKQGWQLDKEWENVTKGKKNLGGTVVASANRDAANEDDVDEEEEAMLESIPFACIICKESYKSPVVTRCKHYFCEPCALKRYRRDPSCAACGSSTNGVFNSATTLKRLLERKRERMAKKRQEAIDAGEEVSDEEEDSDDD